MSDLFEQGIARQMALQPALSTQSQGRPLSDVETTFAEALVDIFESGTHDFDTVATELTSRAVVAPVSGKSAWDKSLLESELKQINSELDTAYAENGYGA